MNILLWRNRNEQSYICLLYTSYNGFFYLHGSAGNHHRRIYNVFRLQLLVFGRYNSFALFSLYLFYEEVFRIAPVYVSNAEMMISKIMKGDGD